MSDLTSDELRARVTELEQDLARTRNAHGIALIERDHYKAMAELNSDTIKNMVAARQQKREGNGND